MPRLVPVTLAVVLAAALTAGCGRAQVPTAATARSRVTVTREFPVVACRGTGT